MSKRELILDNCIVNDQRDCYVIAEIGHNHQGKVDLAREMIKRAHECGANAVKLQKRDNKSLFTEEMYNKPYDNENSFGKTYGEHREALEFGLAEYRDLQAYAKEVGIAFFATPFDFESVDFLEGLNIPFYKVASGDLRNTPLLKYVASTKKPILLSTGAACIDDVVRAYDAIGAVNAQLCFMQCTSIYPTEAKDMNLRVIESYRQHFSDVVVGVSDHQNGIAMSLLAYALGARVFEKHFTLNRAMKGTDHAFSLEPEGLRKLVRDLRRGRLALGSPEKKVLPQEEKARQKMGKKLVAARDLRKGHILTENDLVIKSPGDGISPDRFNEIVGKRIIQPLQYEETIGIEKLAPVSCEEVLEQ